MNLPRDEMAFRKTYATALKEKKITTVFRPGNRVCPANRCYSEEEKVTARIIEVPGSDAHKISPKFTEDKILIRIKKIYSKLLNELTDEDFEGSTEDIKSIQAVKTQLGLIYNTDLEQMNDMNVTVIKFEYPD